MVTLGWAEGPSEKEGVAVWEAGKDGLVRGTRRAGGRSPVPRPETQGEEPAVKAASASETYNQADAP